MLVHSLLQKDLHMKKKVSESAKMHQGMHRDEIAQYNPQLVEDSIRMNRYTGATAVTKEVKLNKPSPKKNSIFGKVS
jgi:hypothetical protein